MIKVLDKVREIQRAPADDKLRITRRIEVGHCVQQGDLYVHHISDDHPRGRQTGKGFVQVALGVGNGARHVAEGAVTVFEGKQLPEGMKAPMDVDPMEVCGPVVVASETWLLTHPEHPHYRLPAGTYQVTYQFDPRTMRRVID